MSLLLSALGIWRRWPFVLLLAGVWAASAMLYLSGVCGAPLYLLGLLQFGGALAVKRGRPRVAWLLLTPLFLGTLFMVYLVSLSLFTPFQP